VVRPVAWSDNASTDGSGTTIEIVNGPPRRSCA
jgi:hypothetical protein